MVCECELRRSPVLCISVARLGGTLAASSYEIGGCQEFIQKLAVSYKHSFGCSVVSLNGFAIHLQNLPYVNLIRDDWAKDDSIGTLFPAINPYCLSGIFN